MQCIRMIFQFRRSAIPVIIVSGPPGSGKTTYVRKHMRHGDLIIDIDMLYMALSGLEWYEKPIELLPFVCEARDAVIARLARESEVGRAWIVTGEADVRKLKKLKISLGAEKLLVMDTKILECKKRIMQDERRSKRAHLWDGIIQKWFDIYSASRMRERASGK